MYKVNSEEAKLLPCKVHWGWTITCSPMSMMFNQRQPFYLTDCSVIIALWNPHTLHIEKIKKLLARDKNYISVHYR